ncbi:protease complex subunit PrcB family protein [Rubrivirga sp. IMCC45206]|uniref:protease complex subunit PrcB family protein n=1 Tax=Rubrivirga sp. IMCC45206 TaxID=3391614 RepID=UPI00398FF9B0
MRVALAPVAAVAVLAGCSLTDGDAALSFRSLASTSAFQPIDPITVVHTEAAADALRERLGLADPIEADFGRETVLAVSTFGACPATNYQLTVVDVEGDGGRAIVSAEVERVGDVGGGALTYPVSVIAVSGLDIVSIGGGAEADVALRLSGDQQDCALR